METQFAPADRLPIEEVLSQLEFLKKHLDLQIIDTVPSISMVLNTYRQIVYANSSLLKLLKAVNLNGIVGVRPGELLQCVHSEEHPGGCGTSESCRQCGAVRAILGTNTGKTSDEEARILVNMNGSINALNLHVHAIPITYENQSFTIVYIIDTSDKENKDILERVFFHDVLNALGGIIGATNLILDEDTNSEIKELSGMVLERANFLANEVKSHRMLVSAENNKLELDLIEINPDEIIHKVVRMYSGNPLALNKSITIISGKNLIIKSDKNILYRILENMLKNALEASLPGQHIEIGNYCGSENIVLFVKNEGYIPKEVQSQIFQKSFSTKGKGRGLGTYSVKFLSENYLNGKARFTSTIENGTNFFIELPFNI